MPAILAPALVKATTPPVSPETMEWAADRLILIGFTPEEAREVGLPSARASGLETAMARVLLGAVLEVSRP